jgi:signal transduction histidine kinase/CheY-like chemotaxis protein
VNDLLPLLLLLALLPAAYSAWRARTALAQAQARLQEAKREAEEIAQLPLNTPHPVVLATKDGAVLFANAAADTAFPELRQDGLRHPALRGLDDGELRSGALFWRRIVVPARAGGTEGFIAYFHDVTALRLQGEALKSARDDADAARITAEKASAARGDFLANMSHEIRTPMNGIVGLSDLLAEALPNGQQGEMAAAVSRSARGLLGLLNDILDFSKIEAGELSIESVPFDPRELLKQAKELHHPQAGRKGLVFSCTADDAVPQRLMGDPGRIMQVLNNLVGNALKFTESGFVRVTASGTADGKGAFSLILRVADTGIGIPKDKQERVFARFRQADGSTARRFGGTGLGLSITRQLAELMGGGVALESAEGKGSTFTVTLPLAIAAAQAQEKEAAVIFEGSSARILAVDDHPVNLLFLRQALARMGFARVDEAACGARALDLFAQSAPDLILLDCQMPDMDGFETARRIRALETPGRRATIIAVTADAMKGAQERCKAAGMDDYISKPVDMSRLRALLRRHLSSGVLDASRLESMTPNDPAMAAQAMALFAATLAEDMQRLQQALARGDRQGWLDAAHKIYGPSALVGASGLAAACDAAQSAPESADLAPFHRRILNEHARLLPLLPQVAV